MREFSLVVGLSVVLSGCGSLLGGKKAGSGGSSSTTAGALQCTITASPNPVAAGKSATLLLKSNAPVTAATLNGNAADPAAVANGTAQVVVSPSSASTYGADVQNSQGSAACTGALGVTGASADAPSCSLTASAQGVTPGQAVTVTMTVSGKAASATLGGQPVTAAGGSQALMPTASTAVLGTVTDTGGHVNNCSIVVNVSGSGGGTSTGTGAAVACADGAPTVSESLTPELGNHGTNNVGNLSPTQATAKLASAVCPASAAGVSCTAVAAPPSGLAQRLFGVVVPTGKGFALWGGTQVSADVQTTTSGSQTAAAGSALADGGIFDAGADTWTLIPSTGAPKVHLDPVAYWSGAKLVIYGGRCGETDGGVFDPGAGTWKDVSQTGAVPATGVSLTHAGKSQVFVSGARLIVMPWNSGGNLWPDKGAGAVYDPDADTWSALPEWPLSKRSFAIIAVSGRYLMVWGGDDLDTPANAYADGAVLDLESKTWSLMTPSGAPTPRYTGVASWLGSKFLVLGNKATPGVVTIDGGVYDPVAKIWTAVAPFTNATVGNQMAPQDVLVKGTKAAVAFSYACCTNGPAPIQVYDVNLNTWTNVQLTMAQYATLGTRQVKLDAFDGSKVLFSTAPGENAFLLDVQLGTLTDVSAALPSAPRSSMIEARLDTGFVLFGGATSETTNSCHQETNFHGDAAPPQICDVVSRHFFNGAIFKQ